MEQVSAQTEKIATYETSRTRRSIVDGTMHSDDSNNDDEYSSSGFYVREKSTKQKSDSSDNTKKETNSDLKENGISSAENSLSSPLVNGENSNDGDNSKESKASTEKDKENKVEIKDDIEPEKGEISEELGKTRELTAEKSEENNVTESKDDIEPEKGEISEELLKTDKKSQLTAEKSEENSVTSCSNNETVKSDSNSKNGKENSVSGTLNNVEKTKTVKSKQKKKVNKTKHDKDSIEVSVGSKEAEKKDNVDLMEKESNKTKEDSEENEESLSKDDEKTSDKKDDKKTIENKNDKIMPNSKDEEKTSGKMDEEEVNVTKGDKEPEDSSAGSILKDHLEKPSNESEDNNEDVEMDEDFDPSLLCPDISMDVDEAPVVTNADETPEDGSISPLPYEPIFSTLVDEITGAEVQIDLTPAEMELRQKMYGPNNPVQTTKVHCTACNVHLGSALTGANNRFVHPLLKVLICKNCYHFYTSGEFEKDEDGSELYCRWCGQGGQVLCCSSCEFVFCKRCIRNNFGPRKFKEIRDSDDWNCFRCEPEQLSNLRASCAEFMEYYRTELGRAQSLAETNPDLMTTDYTKCCCTPPEKKDEPKVPAASKTRRKRKDEEDPDYRPLVDGEEPPAKKLASTGGPGYSVIPPAGVRPVVPKAGTTPTNFRHVGQQPVRPQTASGQVFKVGNTTFRTKTPGTPGYTVQRPTLNQGPRNSSPGYITIPPSTVPKTTTPGYIKILPQRMNTPARPQGAYTVVSGTSNGKPTFSTVRPTKPSQMPAMKHEWFEKTVRAAARVNSNLSYTLTQLNRQQSQANSVEALAMVHNKLQEVLSTSINSLIQIRKNLRTEFIAGIKNIKFPPKASQIPPTTGPIVVKDDDDVIFVNPTTTISHTQPPPLVLSPSITLSKKATQLQKLSDPFSNPKPSTSGVKPSVYNKPALTTTTASTGPKGGFIKVRSFTSLQTVPSECITIPDDPIPPAFVEDPLKLVEDDPLKVTENVEPEDKDGNLKLKDSKDVVKQEQPEVREVPSISFDKSMVYDVKMKPTPEIQKMMDAFVALKRSPDIDDLIQSQRLVNGNGDSDSDKKTKDDGPKETVMSENGVA